MTHEISLETTTSADGTEIGYFRRGVGPALVITHGSVAVSDNWVPATEHLARDFTCLVMDRRGRGRSGDAPEYDLATEASDIAAVMAVAGPGAHLMGHSYGALCALAYAERHRVDGALLLFEPPLAVEGPVAGDGLQTYRELIAAGEYDAAIEFAVINIVRVPPEQIPSLRETPMWATLVELSPTWTRELEQIDKLGADLTHYSSITASTHLIAGTDTTPFLYASAQALAKVIPNASIWYLDGMDHFAHVVNPSAFAATVRSAAL